ncbi:MAG: DoxX family protein [Ferruginibacter sp.]
MKINKELQFALFRAGVCGILMVHGVHKLAGWKTSIPGLGNFLSSEGIPFGNFVAIMITLLETAGPVMVALGKAVKWIPPLIILYLLAGIFMVHMHNGWFVVGPSQDGMEYNVLLIICMLYIWMQGGVKRTSRLVAVPHPGSLAS